MKKTANRIAKTAAILAGLNAAASAYANIDVSFTSTGILTDTSGSPPAPASASSVISLQGISNGQLSFTGFGTTLTGVQIQGLQWAPSRSTPSVDFGLTSTLTFVAPGGGTVTTDLSDYLPSISTRPLGAQTRETLDLSWVHDPSDPIIVNLGKYELKIVPNGSAYTWLSGSPTVLRDASSVPVTTSSNGRFTEYLTADIELMPIPEPSTYLAGALVLLPFGLSALRSIRKYRV